MRQLAVVGVAVCAGAGAFAGEGWEPAGLCGGGGMFSLACSPLDRNVMMLSCDMSQALVSHDGGRTWRMIHHSQLKGCTSCPPAFHPKVRGRVYSPQGWGLEIRLSDDSGLTWRPYVTRPPWKSRPVLINVVPDPPGRVFVGVTDGLFVTNDDGKTWVRCEGVRGKPLGLAADLTAPLASRSYVAGTTEGVFRSFAGDPTRFAEGAAGLPGKLLTSFAGGSDGKITRLYATVPCKLEDGKLTGGVFISEDAGRSWRRAMNPELNVQTKRTSPWAHGDIPQYRYALTTDANPLIAYVHDAGTSYFPPNHCTVYRTSDGGASWRAVLFSDPRFKEYNAADDWLTRGLGQRWQDIPLSMAICPADPNVVMASSSMFVFRTEDGGKHWRACHVGEPAGGAGRETAWTNNGLVVTTTWNYYVDPHQRQRHYICYTDIGFARSEDGGRTWIWGGPAVPWRNTTYELAFDPDTPGRIWLAGSNTHDIPNWNVISGSHRVIMQGGVAVSEDFGRTWKALDLPPAPCLSVAVDPTSPPARRTLYASLFEKGVFRSDDGGNTWQDRSRGLGHPRNMRCCRLVRHADGTLLVLVTAKRLPGGELTLDGVGLYRSSDRGENWTRITESLPLRWPKDFSVHPADAKTILLSAANSRGQVEGGLYRTTDGGKTWQLLLRKGPEHFGAFYHPERPGWVYATLTEGAPAEGLWLSKDDGKTWQPFSGLPFANVQRVHFLPGDNEHIVVTTFGGSVFKGPAEPGAN